MKSNLVIEYNSKRLETISKEIGGMNRTGRVENRKEIMETEEFQQGENNSKIMIIN